MAYRRTLIPDFSLANSLYAYATIYVYGVSAGAKDTSNRPTLYDALFGGGTVANPQELDEHGRWKQPVYVEELCIVEAVPLHAASHDTGIIEPHEGGSFTPVTATGSTTARILADRFADVINIKDYGAVGDGVADDSAAWLAARTAAAAKVSEPGNTSAVFLPEGVYYVPDYTALDVLVDGVVAYGPGRLETLDSATRRYRANNVLQIDSPGSDTPVGSSIFADFDATFRSPWNYQSYITGVDTAGEIVEGSGYLSPNMVAPFYHRSRFTSGGNANATRAVDRSGWAMYRASLEHYGAGDAYCFNANVGMFADDSSVVGFLGKPAGGLYNGQIKAFVDNVVLNPIEINLDDGGFDVTGKGMILNFVRSVGTAALNQVWAGIRLQSSGAEAVDAAYQATGLFKVGLDFTVATITRAITLKEDQEIHFDAVANTRLPCDQWITSEAVTSGVDYRYNAGNVYVAASTGTTGATPPTHSSGTVSDGAVDWTFKHTSSFKGWAATFGETKIYYDSGGSALAVAVGGTNRVEFSATEVNLNSVPLHYAGTKILGAQGAAVSDASGGATIDAEARTAINDLLARLRTHGMIAT